MCELCLNCSYSKLLTSSSSSLASRHSVRRRANETPAQSEREGESGQSAKHSAKRLFSVILGTFFAKCFGFAECIIIDTRQSDHKI